MKLTSIEAIFGALNDAEVRYLVCGGIAVLAYGYVRFTKDLDLALELDSAAIERAFAALAKLGYRPAVPVTARQFADPKVRELWQKDQSEGGKGMTVLNMVSDMHKSVPIDIFVREFFAFDEEYTRAQVVETLPGLPARVVSLPTLIAMKKIANRAQDLDDIEHLEALHQSIKRGNVVAP